MPVPHRIPIPVLGPGTAAELWDAALARMRPRQEPASSSKPTNTTTIIIAAVVVGFIVLIAGALLIRTLRSRHPNPRYIPTPFLKRIWTNWDVPSYSSRHAYLQAGGEDENSARRTSRMREAQDNLEEALGEAQARQNGRSSAAANVDRHTSVRSVMTLPAYRARPADSEQVLGIEGERDGIDMVVEMPTAEDDEALREDEMEALYQIRLARRRQIAEREDRRRLRRDARERNDVVALDELRNQARVASTSNAEEVDELRREHERIKDTRQRAVSSISYADLGVARADGTRIRANSTESERVGLLSDAASISLNDRRASASSLFHRRDRSASSVISIDTSRSNERAESPGLATGGSTYSLHSARASRSRANSGPNTPRQSSTATRAGSSPEIIDAEEADLGDSDMPPPGYDDVSLDDVTPVHSRGSRSGATSPYPEPPPDYPGPSQARNNRLSAHVEDLVAEAATDEDLGNRRSSRGVGGIPQLPSLRLNRLPQIVIDPSSAAPGSDDDEGRRYR